MRTKTCCLPEFIGQSTNCILRAFLDSVRNVYSIAAWDNYADQVHFLAETFAKLFQFLQTKKPSEIITASQERRILPFC